MTTKDFNSLFLNIHDVLEISLQNFYYIITEEGGQKMIDYDYQKHNEKGWIHCTDLIGEYCGFTNNQSGELKIIKIRVFHPFKMSKSYHSYLSLSPSVIVSIVPVLKQKPSVMDEICHTLTMDRLMKFNLGLGSD